MTQIAVHFKSSWPPDQDSAISVMDYIQFGRYESKHTHTCCVLPILWPLCQALLQVQWVQGVRQVQGVRGLRCHQELPAFRAHPDRREEKRRGLIITPKLNVLHHEWPGDTTHHIINWLVCSLFCVYSVYNASESLIFQADNEVKIR